jgi:hypothetical protein
MARMVLGVHQCIRVWFGIPSYPINCLVYLPHTPTFTSLITLKQSHNPKKIHHKPKISHLSSSLTRDIDYNMVSAFHGSPQLSYSKKDSYPISLHSWLKHVKNMLKAIFIFTVKFPPWPFQNTINQEEFFHTVNGCEILHHQTADWCTLQILGCLPSINW